MHRLDPYADSDADRTSLFQRIVVAKPAPRRSPQPRANATEEIRIQDVLEEVIVPGGDAARTLHLRAARRVHRTEEISASDILMEIPTAAAASPTSLAPFALDVPLDLPVEWNAAPAPIALEPLDLDPDGSTSVGLRAAASRAHRQRILAFAGGAFGLLAVLGIVAAVSGVRAPAEAASTLPPAHVAAAAPPAAAPVPVHVITPTPVAPAIDPMSLPSSSLTGAGTNDSPAAPSVTPAHRRASGARTGRVRTAAPDGLLFVDGNSVGRGTAMVPCGAHNVSVGAGNKRRVTVPCGGTVTVR